MGSVSDGSTVRDSGTPGTPAAPGAALGVPAPVDDCLGTASGAGHPCGGAYCVFDDGSNCPPAGGGSCYGDVVSELVRVH